MSAKLYFAYCNLCNSCHRELITNRLFISSYLDLLSYFYFVQKSSLIICERMELNFHRDFCIINSDGRSYHQLRINDLELNYETSYHRQRQKSPNQGQINKSRRQFRREWSRLHRTITYNFTIVACLVVTPLFKGKRAVSVNLRWYHTMLSNSNIPMFIFDYYDV